MSVSRGQLASNAPAIKAITIVPSDTTDLRTSGIRALYVGGAGDITVRLYGDSVDVVFKAVPIGTVLPICPQLIKVATTATLMLGLI
jgi:hypothetical protein